MSKQSENRGEQLIFVGGAPRSGTTLLQNMLDSHSDIFGGPEFQHLPDIIHLRRRMHHSIEKEWIHLICTYQDVDDRVAELIENLLLPMLNRYGAKYLSEKTPENVQVFRDLISLFPAARFLYVIRDPRAVISSLMEIRARAKSRGQNPPALAATIQTALRTTKRCTIAGIEASKKNSDRVLTVIYERLVSEPESEVNRICDFLGVRRSKEMLEPQKFQHLGEEAITTKSGEVWYDKASFNRKIDEVSIDKWKHVLSPIQKLAVNLAFQDIKEDLSKFGYDFRLEGLSVPKRICYFIYRRATLAADFATRGLFFCQERLRKMTTGV